MHDDDNDSDKDGVVNHFDQCPKTPINVTVNNDGCHHEHLQLDKLYFPPRSDELTEESKEIISHYVKKLSQLKTSVIQVIAHTDSMGSNTYNQNLSQQRANSIVNYFKKQGLSHKFIAKGMGEIDPIASNDTAEGRKLNRRVELEVIN
jgi:OOP family OmpA-OmpF porin